jgi:uncharacterized protein
LIYVDTSAAFKLMKPEVHSDALTDYLGTHDDLVSSMLLAVELRRGALRSAPRTLPRVDLLLARVDLIDIDAVVVESASRLPDPLLRTLDAIHVATALLLGADVDALVSYDNRMLTAAQAYDIPTACPT